jgi:hypothetical protein
MAACPSGSGIVFLPVGFGGSANLAKRETHAPGWFGDTGIDLAAHPAAVRKKSCRIPAREYGEGQLSPSCNGCNHFSLAIMIPLWLISKIIRK